MAGANWETGLLVVDFCYGLSAKYYSEYDLIDEGTHPLNILPFKVDFDRTYFNIKIDDVVISIPPKSELAIEIKGSYIEVTSFNMSELYPDNRTGLVVMVYDVRNRKYYITIGCYAWHQWFYHGGNTYFPPNITDESIYMGITGNQISSIALILEEQVKNNLDLRLSEECSLDDILISAHRQRMEELEKEFNKKGG